MVDLFCEYHGGLEFTTAAYQMFSGMSAYDWMRRVDNRCPVCGKKTKATDQYRQIKWLLTHRCGSDL